MDLLRLFPVPGTASLEVEALPQAGWAPELQRRGFGFVEAIKTGGKKLAIIYVSQSDPDYYFSLGPIKAAFPDPKVIAASGKVVAFEQFTDTLLVNRGMNGAA